MAAEAAPNQREARRAARLAAVQALYQLDLNEANARQVVAEFVTHRLEPDTDHALFSELVTGVTERLRDVDGMIAGSLTEAWTVERLEAVLRAILRAGCFELLTRADVPPRVTISEYVEIAHAFFAGKEPGLVNGVLDNLAKILRPDALKAR